MNKTLFLVTAVSALSAAAPAASQSRSQYGVDTSFDARIGAMQSRLDAGVRAGTIDRREAWTLRQRLRDVSRLEQRYSLGGFSAWERSDLQARLRSLRQDLRVADNGSWDRYDRYAYEDEGYYGRGGPLEDVICERRGGVGGFIDSLTGRDTCYVVGDRIGGDLYAVPSDYSGRYRDSGSIYYRSDGRAVYGIDARTNTVVSVHKMPR